MGSDEMVQQIKGLPDKPDGLRSIPGPYMAREVIQLLKVVLRVPHRYCGMCVDPSE